MIDALALAVLAPLSTANAQSTSNTWEVSVCVGCTTTAEFNAAARQVTGTTFNGELEVLVINPTTNVSRFVTVFNTPPDEEPWSLPTEPLTTTTESTKGTTRSAVRIGSAVSLYADPTAAIVFAEDLTAADMQATSTTYSSRAATASEAQEIGAMIEFGNGDYVVTLPNSSEFFGSFTGREPAAVANEVFRSMTEHNVGWAGKTVSDRIKQLIKKRLEVAFGKSFKVCVIFNNGDSACINPDAATPSVENYIEGTAKTKTGEHIGSGGSGGGGLNVSNDFLPNGAWGPSGGSGGSGELWLFCSFVGGQLQHCWTEIR